MYHFVLQAIISAIGKTAKRANWWLLYVKCSYSFPSRIYFHVLYQISCVLREANNWPVCHTRLMNWTHVPLCTAGHYFSNRENCKKSKLVIAICQMLLFLSKQDIFPCFVSDKLCSPRSKQLACLPYKTNELNTCTTLYLRPLFQQSGKIQKLFDSYFNN